MSQQVTAASGGSGPNTTQQQQAPAQASPQPQQQQKIRLELLTPLPDGAAVDPEKYCVLIANDKKTRFAVPRAALVRFSKLYRALAQSSDIEELPLQCQAATADITALLATWVVHYATTHTPSRVNYPLQPGNELNCFLNSWDSVFVEQLLFRGSRSIANNCGRVYSLAITATFLQAQVLVELCSGVFAFFIREAELASRPVQAPSGESTIRSWFGLTGDFSAQERQLILEQNKDLRDPQGVLEKIKEMSDESHDTAAALAFGNNVADS